MEVQTFRGISLIQEVICSGSHLDAEVEVTSLKLYRVSDNSVLAFVSHVSNECKTFGEFSSCIVDFTDTRRTKLRVLVPDLAEGEMEQLGCTVLVTRLKSLSIEQFTWKLSVERSELSLKIICKEKIITTRFLCCKNKFVIISLFAA